MAKVRESEVRGRLAPSPTGAQHVGNARTYLIAWLSARSQSGRLLLRIEDIDSPASNPAPIRNCKTTCAGSASTGTPAHYGKLPDCPSTKQPWSG